MPLPCRIDTCAIHLSLAPRTPTTTGSGFVFGERGVNQNQPQNPPLSVLLCTARLQRASGESCRF